MTPLNNFEKLCYACKVGDLDLAKIVVETKQININLQDEWQRTPLYLACLCGHYEVVEYLIKAGARCERFSFEGERCIYGALNDKIKKLLLNNEFKKAVNTSMPYLNTFNKMFNNPSQFFSDFTIIIIAKSRCAFKIHKFVLAARSKYFKEKFIRWEGRAHKTVKNGLIEPKALKVILNYLYTGLFELGGTSLNSAESFNVVYVANKLKLKALVEFYRQARKKAALESLTVMQKDYSDFYKQEVNRQKSTGPSEIYRINASENAFCDILLKIKDHSFFCHKSILSARSLYFEHMFKGDYAESFQIEKESHLNRICEIELGFEFVNPWIFSKILFFIYTDISLFEPNELYEALIASNFYSLQRLEGIISVEITQVETEAIPIYSLYEISLSFDLSRIEQHCTRTFAKNIENHKNDPKFIELIQKSASSIKNRQETDTIPIVDDIRFWLNHIYGISTSSDFQNANIEGNPNDNLYMLDKYKSKLKTKLDVLDDILYEMGLDV